MEVVIFIDAVFRNSMWGDPPGALTHGTQELERGISVACLRFRAMPSFVHKGIGENH
jgi:hypothetical protein